MQNTSKVVLFIDGREFLKDGETSHWVHLQELFNKVGYECCHCSPCEIANFLRISESPVNQCIVGANVPARSGAQGLAAGCLNTLLDNKIPFAVITDDPLAFKTRVRLPAWPQDIYDSYKACVQSIGEKGGVAAWCQASADALGVMCEKAASFSAVSVPDALRYQAPVRGQLAGAGASGMISLPSTQKCVIRG